MKRAPGRTLLGLLAWLTLTPGLAETNPPLLTLEGQPLTLDAYQGRAVLVNFWATWCGPCRKEMPELDHLAQQLDPAQAVVLGIAADEPAAVAAFLQDLPVTYQIATGDPDQMFSWSTQLGNRVQVLPFSALLDGNGEVTWIKMGELDFKELTPLLSNYLKPAELSNEANH